MKEKTVMIPMSLFNKIVQYHVLDQKTEGLDREITNGLQDKVFQINRRSFFTAWKTAADPEVRESARTEYLQRSGIADSRIY